MPAQHPIQPTQRDRLRPASRLALRGAILCLLPCVLGGCAVVAVADVATSAVVGVAGLAVDAAVGTARIGGKVIGATADAVLDSDESAAK